VTGPEHYDEAEKLLMLARDTREDPVMIARAQVHATLAQVAATINTLHQDINVPDWTEAIT
jgi:hypothetical protein